MAIRRSALLVSVAVPMLTVTACGSDDQSSDTTAETATTAAVTTAAPSTTVVASTPTGGSLDLPAATTPPNGSADLPAPAPVDTSDSPVLISVQVGSDDSPDRIETVPVGSVVTISVVNPDHDDEFHLHDYDLGDGREIPAGQVATFTFVADHTGDFELESHSTDDVLLVVRVA